MLTPITISIDLDQLADRVEVLLRERRKEAPPTAGATVYGSRAPHPAPPGKSYRWLREHGQELLAYGAVRHGGKRGRDVVWTISSEGFERWAADQARPTTPAPIEPAANVVDINQWITSAGYRATKGRGT